MAAKKKAPAKKAAPKKTAKKAPAKKAPAKKAAAKKAPAKKAAAKKAPARKAAAKKAPAKKAAAKKAPAKKAAPEKGGKKASAKKTASRRAAKSAPEAGGEAPGEAAPRAENDEEAPAAEVNPMVEAGQRAPAFSLPDENGNTVSLDGLRGKHVVLYFYPKDLTPGCTLEGQDFSKLADAFAGKGAVVFGVSADTPALHQKFKQKCGIGIPLLADTEKAAISAFGVWQEKVMYGQKKMGIVRSTFLIGPDGVLKKVWPKVKVAGHAEDVLASI